MSIYFLYVKTHNVTGLKYLGQTSQCDPHRYQGSGTYWKRHLKKHGKNYSTEIIKECLTIDDLMYWGTFYSKLWNIIESDEWANLKEESGDGGKGMIHSEECKRQMSIIKKRQYENGEISPWNKGKTGIFSEETRKKISEAGKGRVHSNETKLKMSNADRSSYTRVTPVSEETKEKQSNLRKGQSSPAKGIKWSKEQKQKLSESRIGRICPTKGKRRQYRSDGSFYFINKNLSE